MSNDLYYWNTEEQRTEVGYYEADYSRLQTQPLDFDPVDYGDQSPNDLTKVYEPVSFAKTSDFDEEPPLLEELEIYPDRIVEKMLAVLNPFKSHGLTDDASYLNQDSDLAGPVFFYLILAVCLFLSGNNAHFGYIYGLSVVSCLMMYCLLSLMTSQKLFNVTAVASVLGYSLIPIVALSAIGVFLSLKGVLGIVLAVLSIFWSSVSASRLFVAISGDKEQQLLIAYPCALVSALYVLLVVF